MDRTLECSECGPTEAWTSHTVDIAQMLQRMHPHHPAVPPTFATVATCDTCGELLGYDKDFIAAVSRTSIQAARIVALDLAKLTETSFTEGKRLVPVPVVKLAGLVHWALTSLGEEPVALALDDARSKALNNDD